MPHKVFLLVFICSILIPISTNVLAEEASATQCEWNLPSAGPVTTWTAPLCGKKKLVVQPFFFYNRTRGIFDGEGHYKSFTNNETKSQYQEQLFLQYGVTDYLEIDAQGVYQQNLRHLDGDNAASTGFSDFYLFARYCVLEESKLLPHATALFQLKLPTGKYQKADEGRLGTDLMGATSGGGSYDTGYGILLTKKFKPFILHADLLYSFPMPARVDGVKTRYGDYVNYDLGIEYFLPYGINLVCECNGFIQGDRKADGEYLPASDVQYLNISPGIGWSCDKIQMLVAYQRTLTGTNVDVNDSVIFTFVYTF